MHNYVITHLSCRSIFQVMFAAGSCVGGFFGVLLGLMERDVVGFLGGAFLGLIFGLLSGLISMCYAVVFNMLTPYIGGIKVRVETLEVPAPSRNQQEPAEEQILS